MRDDKRWGKACDKTIEGPKNLLAGQMDQGMTKKKPPDGRLDLQRSEERTPRTLAAEGRGGIATRTEGKNIENGFQGKRRAGKRRQGVKRRRNVKNFLGNSESGGNA